MRRGAPERERGYRRALRVGLLLSLLVHAAVIWIVGGELRPEREEAPAAEVREPTPRGAVESVRVRPRLERPGPVPEPAPPRPAREMEREEEPPREETGAEAVEEAAAGEGEEAEEREEVLTNAEKLRPRVGDPRLWVPFEPGELTRSEEVELARARRALRRLLGTYLDSLALTEEQRRRAREWVVEDGDQKWGISPEGLHLGDITIPIPFGELLQRSGPERREAEQILRTYRLIQFKAGQLQAEEVREDRLEAMRERTREKLEEGLERGAADTVAADTTGSRRPP